MSSASAHATATMRGELVVIGHPIAHSLSPRMHAAALAALGLGDRITYAALDVAPEELRAFVEALRAGRYLGANVTAPHKRAVMALSLRIEPDAAAIGAVNTLAREADGTLVGANTDAPGLGRALAEAGAVVRGARALVLGAGGAARAAVVALGRAGAARIDVAARRSEEASALVASLAPVLPDVALDVVRLERSVLAARAAPTTLVVQATSATLDEEAGGALAARVPFTALRPDALVCDLVYRPRQTAVLRAAARAGLRTLDGTGMLVHQGALALERWLGVTAPVDAMRAAVLDALDEPRTLQS